ncbi:MAG: glycosyltransferase [Candidatus Aenigmatarchaeota archaeon]
MSIGTLVLLILAAPFFALPITLTIDILTLACHKVNAATKRKSGKKEGDSDCVRGELVPSKKVSSKPAKDVTVIISAHKESGLIEDSIRSVLRQGYSIKNIYISDSNLDNTKEEVEKLKRTIAGFRKKFPKIYYWSKEGMTSKSEKLNQLIRDPKVRLGKYVYFLDSGLNLHPGTIERLVESAIEEGAVASTSYGYVTPPKSYPAKYFHYGKEWINRISRFRKRAQSYRRGMFVVCGASFLVKSEVAKKIPIPTNVRTEDTAYTWAIQEEGHKISFTQDAIVSTVDVPTLKRELKQSYRWYLGTWQVMYLHRSVFGMKSKAKSLAYLSVLPGLFETTTYTISVLMFPFLLYFLPIYAAYFAIGDTVLSFFAPIMGHVFSGQPGKIPRELLHTVRHYHQILAFKFFSSALWILTGANMIFDVATGRSKNWGNKW